MYKRAKRQYYASYFRKIKLPNLFSEDEVQEQLTLLRAGSVEARDALTLHYMRLTFAIAGRYMAKNKMLDRADILATGIKALVECLQRIMDGSSLNEHNNLSAYVHTRIRGEIQNHCSIDGYVVVPPLNSEWLETKIKLEGNAFLKNMFQTVRLVEENSNDSEDDSEYVTGTSKTPVNVTGVSVADVRSQIFVDDIMQTEYLTSREKQILRMRCEDINEIDIAIQLRISQPRVSAIIKNRLIPVVRRIIKGDLP